MRVRNLSKGEILFAIEQIRHQKSKDCKEFLGDGKANCHLCSRIDVCHSEIVEEEIVYCANCCKAMLKSEPEKIKPGNLCISCHYRMAQVGEKNKMKKFEVQFVTEGQVTNSWEVESAGGFVCNPAIFGVGSVRQASIQGLEIGETAVIRKSDYEDFSIRVMRI